MFDTLKALGDQLIAQTAPTPPSVMQAIFSLLALFVGLSALMVGVTRNLFHSLLCLVATLFGVAAIYFMLEAEFVASADVSLCRCNLLITCSYVDKGMMFGGTSPVNRQSLIPVIISGLLFVTLTGVLTNIPWPAGNGSFPTMHGDR
jgi:NADH-quinone oxidoreductase subunit J